MSMEFKATERVDSLTLGCLIRTPYSMHSSTIWKLIRNHSELFIAL